MTSPSSDPSVSGLLETFIPERLWHYTSFRSALSIVESKSIYATDIRFLNDSEEFVHARKLLVEIAEQESDENADLTPIIRNEVKREVELLFDEGPLGPRLLQTCVACFSEAEDQLSQWRGYASSSSGVSLCFDLRQIRETLDRPLAVFAPCIYDDAAKRAILRKIVKALFDAAAAVPRAAWNAGSDPANHEKDADTAFGEWVESDVFKDVERRIDEARKRASYDLIRVAALMKHEAFREEQEWRLVIPLLKGFNDEDGPIYFTAQETTLVPRIMQRLGSTQLPLSQIILGPGTHAHSTEAVQNFLASQRLPSSVRQSRAPYRTTR